MIIVLETDGGDFMYKLEALTYGKRVKYLKRIKIVTDNGLEVFSIPLGMEETGTGSILISERDI